MLATLFGASEDWLTITARGFFAGQEKAADESFGIIRGLEASTPKLPAPVFRERALMAGHILIQTCADFERGLADAAPASGKTWRKVGSGLVDALVGLWSAPVSR